MIITALSRMSLSDFPMPLSRHRKSADFFRKSFSISFFVPDCLRSPSQKSENAKDVAKINTILKIDTLSIINN